MPGEKFELGIGDGHHLKKRNASHYIGPKCKATFFALTIVLTSIAINSIYLEARLAQMEKRLEGSFERRLKKMKKNFESEITEDTNTGEFSEELPVDGYPKDFIINLPRQKRQAEIQPTTANSKCHSGIASARIAVLYGDRGEVQKRSDRLRSSAHLKMRPCNAAPITPVCYNGSYTNDNGDEWCRRADRSSDIYALRGNKVHYRYFAKASWMNTPESSQYYGILGDDGNSDSVYQMIEVKQPGMYIITSSMRFTELRAAEGQTVSAAYGVYINNRIMNSTRAVSNCAHTHRGSAADDGSKVFPCTTWQLVPLLENDRVFMRIEPYVYFEIRKDTMFLALIKLNDDILDLPMLSDGPSFRG